MTNLSHNLEGVLGWGRRILIPLVIATCASARAGDWRHPDARFLLVDEALAQDDYAQAQKELAGLRGEAKKGRDAAFTGEIGERSKEVARMARDFDKISKSWKALSSGRNDKKAAAIVGGYYAEVRGDWDKALPLMAAGDVEALAEAAAGDRPGATDPSEQFRIADSWWQYGLTIADAARRGPYHLRAREWMLRARLGVEADQRTIIDQRLRQIPLFPEAILIWNTHNNIINERGADELIVSLHFQGKSVWKRATPMPWRANEPAYLLLRPPRLRVDEVRIEITRAHPPGPGLGEIEVIGAGTNLATHCRATASSVWEFNEKFKVENLLDGDKSGNTGYWLAMNGATAWAGVHLSELNADK